MLEQIRNAVIVDATIFIHGSEGRIQNFYVVRSHIRIIMDAKKILARLVSASWTAFAGQSMEGFTKNMYKITVELKTVL